ncbi:MAG: 4Fe-4S binding protein [Anaerolineaceae bacterium]|nr:4Fe-4S binding protein [Anaerolineaceae bacterium]
MSAELPKTVSLEASFCGRILKSPFILSSGPLSYNADGIIAAMQAGCGAVVTKTIRLQPAQNPPNHIITAANNSLINCEKWSDIAYEQWCSVEIPKAVQNGGVLIASLGHTLQEAKVLAKELEHAGAHMLELVSYSVDDLLPMLDYVRAAVNIPVICKLSANWPNLLATAKRCIEHKADGLCAIDSIGPVLKIDISGACPELLSENGYGWLSGAAVRPVALRINADVALQNPGFQNLYSSGGCMTATDAMEFLMAGASAVGVCSVVILKGLPFIQRLNTDLEQLMRKYGYENIQSLVGKALPNLARHERHGRMRFHFQPFHLNGSAKCINCKKCELVCSYSARKIRFPTMEFSEAACRSCGLCVNVCPTGALGFSIQEENTEPG